VLQEFGMVQLVQVGKMVLFVLLVQLGTIITVIPIKGVFHAIKDMFGMDIIVTHQTMFNVQAILNGMGINVLQMMFIVHQVQHIMEMDVMHLK
jgi:H+/gluconate symporter-like permease